MTQEQTEQPDARRIGRWAWMICSVLIALMLGFVAGYYLRPIADGPVAEAKGSQSLASIPAAGGVAEPPSSMTEAVVRQTRHWKGDASAPVIIVEFADFQ